jgi:hypothetical protein
LCGVGKSAKSGDLTKIGTFGIGFKSVYAYTSTPRVHGSGEHFRIENYVRPYAEDPLDEPGGPGSGTIFIFPFDHAEVLAAVAAAEISAALNEIGAGALLFLRNIRRLRVAGFQVTDTVLERTAIRRSDASRQVTLADGRGRGGEEWYVWHRPLDGIGLAGLRVEVAFGVLGGALARRDASPLVVFFPTQRETFLGFLIQGPYRTTPARDNVPDHDPSNLALVGETAALLADVLLELRQDGLLSVEVLQALPLDAARFAPGTMFRPLFDSVRAALASEQLIPLASGGYGSAAELRLARGEGLHGLLSPEQLGALYGGRQALAFAHDAITDSRTPALWRYLREEAGVEEVTPEGVVGCLSSEFLAAQPDAWISRCYAFLHQDIALWRAPGSQDEVPGPALAAPIIRLEDGRHVAPFDAAGRPAAYLPGLSGLSGTGFPTVRRAIASEPAARRFLDALGFTEPDVVDEVLEIIVPWYASAEVADLDPAQHAADLELIWRALDEAAPARRHRLDEQLRQTAFLIGENAGTSERRLMTPAVLYERTKDLEVYFEGNPDAWFADDGYGPWLAQLRGLGVRPAVQPEARKPDQVGFVVTIDEFGRHERGIDGFDPSAQLDGLDFALRHPNHARSEYVWNALLSASPQLVAGVVESSPRDSFADSSRREESSAIGRAATECAWLPGPDGVFCRPAALRVDDLPARYKRDEILVKALGMIQSLVEDASRQLGIPADVLRGLSQHPDLVAMVDRELKARAAASEP